MRLVRSYVSSHLLRSAVRCSAYQGRCSGRANCTHLYPSHAAQSRHSISHVRRYVATSQLGDLSSLSKKLSEISAESKGIAQEDEASARVDADANDGTGGLAKKVEEEEEKNLKSKKASFGEWKEKILEDLEGVDKGSSPGPLHSAYNMMVFRITKQEELQEAFDVSKKWSSLCKSKQNQSFRPLSSGLLKQLKNKAFSIRFPEFGMYMMMRHEEIGLVVGDIEEGELLKNLLTKLSMLKHSLDRPSRRITAKRDSLKKDSEVGNGTKSGDERAEKSYEAQVVLLNYIFALLTLVPSALQPFLKLNQTDLLYAALRLIEIYSLRQSKSSHMKFREEEVRPRINAIFESFLQHDFEDDSPSSNLGLLTAIIEYVRLKRYTLNGQDKTELLLDKLEQVRKTQRKAQGGTNENVAQ
jgi:hypothetical protein